MALKRVSSEQLEKNEIGRKAFCDSVEGKTYIVVQGSDTKRLTCEQDGQDAGFCPHIFPIGTRFAFERNSFIPKRI